MCIYIYIYTYIYNNYDYLPCNLIGMINGNHPLEEAGVCVRTMNGYELVYFYVRNLLGWLETRLAQIAMLCMKLT